MRVIFAVLTLLLAIAFAADTNTTLILSGSVTTVTGTSIQVQNPTSLPKQDEVPVPWYSPPGHKFDTRILAVVAAPPVLVALVTALFFICCGLKWPRGYPFTTPTKHTYSDDLALEDAPDAAESKIPQHTVFGGDGTNGTNGRPNGRTNRDYEGLPTAGNVGD